jgi:hypothetical protein
VASGLSLTLREIQPGPGTMIRGPFFSNRADRRRLLFTREGREQTRYARMVASKGQS